MIPLEDFTDEDDEDDGDELSEEIYEEMKVI